MRAENNLRQGDVNANKIEAMQPFEVRGFVVREANLIMCATKFCSFKLLWFLV